MLNSPFPGDDNTYGQELTLDLYDCDLATISDGEKIKEFVIELCDKIIMMKRYGEPMIPHFGHENPITSGYSLVQLIETSNVSAHFSEHKKAVYLNIFSCAWFDPIKAEDYCRKCFGAKSCTSHLQKRI